MKSIWKLFWDICLFRRGPESVPVSAVLVSLVILGFVVFNAVVRTVLLSSSIGQSFLSSLLVTLVFAGGLWLGLGFKGFLSRFPQTITAVFGQDLVISILSLPLLLVFLTQQSEANSALGVGSVFLFLLYGWDLAVKGFILRNALEIGPGLALMFALTLVVSAILFENQLFGSDEQRLEPSVREQYIEENLVEENLVGENKS